jgi:hypothetical protein
VNSISAAIVYGICRGSLTAEPPSGYRLHFASATPNFADSPAIRMSVPCRISVPPAIAGPSTAAISGLESLEQTLEDRRVELSGLEAVARRLLVRGAEVHPGAEVAAGAGQDAHPDLGVGVHPVPGVLHDPQHV